MESILARALEYTLKYWLKSFSRDQFKLQGRTAQLSNLGRVLLAILFELHFFSTRVCVCVCGAEFRELDLKFSVVFFFWLVDINGDALHASMGLPPALNVTTAKVGKLEIVVSRFAASLIR